MGASIEREEQRMLKIYGRANSINVRKVLWFADETGLAYTREDWGRGFRPTSDPEFVKLSPFGVVPVIDDDGFILRESNTILRYLAAKHGHRMLYPTELRQRALVECWMDWANTDAALPMRPVFQAIAWKVPTDPKALESGIAGWNNQMRLLDQHLAKQGPYVVGANFTIGDIPVGLTVNRWINVPFDKPKLPALEAYYARLRERPACRAHTGPENP
jgi:glutathione S-transferase